jgi:hypothetical protein
VVHAPFGAAGIDAWRKKVDFQQTFGYGHRNRGTALGNWWTSNKQRFFEAGDAAGLALAGASGAAYLSFFGGNAVGPIEGAVLAEAADKVTDISNGVQTFDHCIREGASSNVCRDSASTSLLLINGDILFTGLPAGTILSVLTDSNDALSGWSGS